eukprot:Platyproteum_vivax@DN7716_c0_g1_i1.p1
MGVLYGGSQEQRKATGKMVSRLRVRLEMTNYSIFLSGEQQHGEARVEHLSLWAIDSIINADLGFQIENTSQNKFLGNFRAAVSSEAEHKPQVVSSQEAVAVEGPKPEVIFDAEQPLQVADTVNKIKEVPLHEIVESLRFFSSDRTLLITTGYPNVPSLVYILDAQHIYNEIDDDDKLKMNEFIDRLQLQVKEHDVRPEITSRFRVEKFTGVIVASPTVGVIRPISNQAVSDNDSWEVVSANWSPLVSHIRSIYHVFAYKMRILRVKVPVKIMKDGKEEIRFKSIQVVGLEKIDGKALFRASQTRYSDWRFFLEDSQNLNPKGSVGWIDAQNELVEVTHDKYEAPVRRFSKWMFRQIVRLNPNKTTFTFEAFAHAWYIVDMSLPTIRDLTTKLKKSFSGLSYDQIEFCTAPVVIEGAIVVIKVGPTDTEVVAGGYLETAWELNVQIKRLLKLGTRTVVAVRDVHNINKRTLNIIGLSVFQAARYVSYAAVEGVELKLKIKGVTSEKPYQDIAVWKNKRLYPVKINDPPNDQIIQSLLKNARDALNAVFNERFVEFSITWQKWMGPGRYEDHEVRFIVRGIMGEAHAFDLKRFLEEEKPPTLTNIETPREATEGAVEIWIHKFGQQFQALIPPKGPYQGLETVDFARGLVEKWLPLTF